MARRTEICAPCEVWKGPGVSRVAFHISSPYLEAKTENSGTYRQFVELQRKSYRCLICTCDKESNGEIVIVKLMDFSP
jgi:hypothetical protein